MLTTESKHSIIRVDFKKGEWMSFAMMSAILVLVGASTVAGVFLGLFIRRIPHRFNDVVLGFAAGIMLAASVCGLLMPAFGEKSGRVFLAIAGTFAGAGLASVLDRVVPHLHRIAGIDAESHRTNGTINKTLLFVAAMALHKLPEGVATGVSFAAGDMGDAITVAGSISLQNIPESIVIVAPLFAIGLTTARVVGISFAIASVSIASVLIGCVLGELFAGAMPFLLGAAGGAMLYVISDEMIPETHSHGYEKPATFALISGFVLVLLLQRLLQGVSV